ncbi:agmatine deiminase family protein [Pelagicoccus sp. NFK12]|uniref:Agmatine deiminase family protein n=1 Tax=Pelagicoccus enzymogenes TaxID=2773457 RepID=A0A927F6C2_9BACT|nr:agmatine deiminase family protein [Pelagicoccus enzymogenes]MBD5778810.1 agmatine deiminase family protein [Pelagicoccus enzymogenes]
MGRITTFVRILCVGAATMSAVPSHALPSAPEASSPSTPPFDESLIWQTVEAAPVGFFSAMTLPTRPVPLDRAVTDSQEAAAILLNLSIQECLSDPELLLCYKNLISTLAPYVPVLLGYDDSETRDLERARIALGIDETSSIGDSVAFVESRSKSYWIRDYGPIFAIGKDGKLIVVDPIFGNWEQEFRSFAEDDEYAQATTDYVVFKKRDRKSDLTPLVLTSYFRREMGIRSETSRPPLLLLGGNYLPNGSDLALVSEDTILANGGLRNRTEQVIRAYLGSQQIVFLESVPHPLESRLDSQVSFLDARTVLVASPPASSPQSSSAAKFLTRQLGEVYRANLNALGNGSLGIEIRSIPSLPLREATLEEALQAIRESVKQSLNASADTNEQTVQQLEKLAGKPIDLDSLEGLATATALVLQRNLEPLVEEFRIDSMYQRTFTNGLCLNLGAGRLLQLLPRYTAAPGERGAAIQEIEKRVEAEYLNTAPHCEIVWIEADALASRGGSLRRAAMIVPKVQISNTE